MEGHVDTTFTTSYRDMLSAGTIAEIGVNAFAVWHAIKNHADFNTGHSWPGMRTIGTMTGLPASSVHKAIGILVTHHLLRVIQSATRRRGQTYIACERLRISIGSTLVCTIVVDYLPAKLRDRVNRVTNAIQTGENDPDAFAEVQVIPSPGLVWDSASCSLRGALPVNSLLPAQPAADDPALIAGRAILDGLKSPPKK